jgi:periplasmic copper chaperone A
MNTPTRTLARLLAAATATFALSIAQAGHAAAHIVLDEAIPNDDGTTTLVFVFDHGCGAEPTIDVEMSLPDGVEVMDADQPQDWSADVDTDSVHWSGPPIPSREVTELTVTASITGAPGESFQFPTIQRCENNESHHWIEPEGGENPAPALIATAAMVTMPSGPSASTTAVPESDAASNWQVFTAIAILAGISGTVGFVSRASRGAD